jgi:hypothetical protein
MLGYEGCDTVTDIRQRIVASVDNQLAARVQALEKAALDGELADFLRMGERDGKIVPATRGLWERAFRTDAKVARADLAAAPPVVSLGKSSSAVAGESENRQCVVSKAISDWDKEHEVLSQLTSCRSYVNDQLRLVRLPPLSEDEAKALPLY